MIARAFLQSALSSALVLAIGVVTGGIAARVLGPEDRGYLGIVFFWASLLSVFASLSVGDAVVLATGRSAGGGLASAGRRLVWTAVVVGWPIGTAIVALAVWPLGGGLILASILFWSVQLVEYCTTQLAFGLLRREARFAAINVIRVSMPACYLVFSAAAALLGEGLRGFIVAQALALSVGIVVQMHYTRDLRADREDQAALSSSLVRPALSLHGITIITTCTAMLDRFIVIQTMTPSAMGIYFVAASIAGPAQSFLSVAIQSIALPAFLRASEDRRSQNALRLLRITWAISLAGAGGVALLAPLVVPLLFGAAFESSGVLATALAFATAFAPFRASQIEILKSVGLGRSAIYGEAVFAGACLTAAGTASLLALRWPVVWGLALGHAAAALWLSRSIATRFPDVTLLAWLVPRWSTLAEVSRLLRQAIWSRAQRRL